MAPTKSQASHVNRHVKAHETVRLIIKHEITLTKGKIKPHQAGPRHRGKQELWARRVIKNTNEFNSVLHFQRISVNFSTQTLLNGDHKCTRKKTAQKVSLRLPLRYKQTHTYSICTAECK